MGNPLSGDVSYFSQQLSPSTIRNCELFHLELAEKCTRKWILYTKGDCASIQSLALIYIQMAPLLPPDKGLKKLEFAEQLLRALLVRYPDKLSIYKRIVQVWKVHIQIQTTH